MKESTCLRMIVVGVILIAAGLIIPGIVPDVARAVPIVVGSALTLVASYALFRLPDRYRNGDGGRRGG